jgi:hypothetical protein
MRGGELEILELVAVGLALGVAKIEGAWFL